MVGGQFVPLKKKYYLVILIHGVDEKVWTLISWLPLRHQADKTGHQDPRKDCGWSHKTGGVLMTPSSALSQEESLHMSRNMKFPTMWYVRPAKPQISLRIGAV